jgi:hypothetical protein
MTQCHDGSPACHHTESIACGLLRRSGSPREWPYQIVLRTRTLRRSTNNDHARVCLTPAARKALTKLDPSRREALTDGFRRVGRELLSSAEQITVEAGWARRTWPRRRYPQQCYARTVKYIVDHPEIMGMRLIHGVVSHAPHLVPFDHAWVELPGDVVFDGVVQTFFTQASYYDVMAALALDAYSGVEMTGLVAEHGHPGPWNAKWVPTPLQLQAYVSNVCPHRAVSRTPQFRR